MLQWDVEVGTKNFYASRTALDYRKGDFPAMKNELSKIMERGFARKYCAEMGNF